MARVITFGELMLRLQPFNYERFVQAQRHQGKAQEFDAQGEYDVLPHDADAFAGDADGFGDL